MNYYDELLEHISFLIKNKEYDLAKKEIQNELEMIYVPKDVEQQLKEYLLQIKDVKYTSYALSEEDIFSFLFKDEKHQLLAVNELDHRNLRDYLELCEKYLLSDGFINAKVLLIDSLISQQVNHDFVYHHDNKNTHFNPARIQPFQDTQAYQDCQHLLQEKYMKEPSKMILAEQLLYKEALFLLPETMKNEDVSFFANKIVAYMEDAFNQL